MVSIHHYPHSVKVYSEAAIARRAIFPVPERCLHPECRAIGSLIRWGFYERQARTGEIDYLIRIQRVRCKVCKRTHSLLPDFLHPFRRFVLPLLQEIVEGYLVDGLGWNRLLETVYANSGPGRSTVREWIASFAYGAGDLLLDWLTRQLFALDPLIDLPDAPPPRHLNRVPNPTQRRRLQRAHSFWLLARQLYALVKAHRPTLHFAADQLFPFLLHWLQNQALPPRLFWNPTLVTTPSQPF